MVAPLDLVLPRWFVVGVLLGLLVGVLIAVVFYVGVRYYPDTGARAGGSYSYGDEYRRREIHRYLEAIGERVFADHLVDGQRVDFYLPDRDVAITFDGRTFFELERCGTVVVLVEAEMPIAHLAARLPFDVPRFGDRNEVRDVPRAAYAVLGVPIDADESEIRAAYREKVKAAHPDRGGSREAFAEVRQAYLTAKEHAARSRVSREA